MKDYFFGAILLYVLIKQSKMSQVSDKINASLASIGGSVDNVAADIKKLVAQNADGLSADEATAISSKLEAIASNVKSVSDIVPDDIATGDTNPSTNPAPVAAPVSVDQNGNPVGGDNSGTTGTTGTDTAGTVPAGTP